MGKLERSNASKESDFTFVRSKNFCKMKRAKGFMKVNRPKNC